MITQEILKQLLAYNRRTGLFRWKTPVSSYSRVEKGTVAGSTTVKGYVLIWVHDRRYQAHKLAWLYVTGEWPEAQIDHKNRNKSDNRWSNLRPATNKQNQENAGLRKDNTSGYRGVWWRPEVNKWKAMIRHDGYLYTLGYFENKNDAIAARKAAEQKYFTHAP